MAVVFWSKLDSDATITTPEIGPSCVVETSETPLFTYETAQYGNGVKMPIADGTENSIYTNSSILDFNWADDWSIEFWYACDFNAGDEIPDGQYCLLFILFDDATNNYIVFYPQFWDSPNNARIVINANASGEQVTLLTAEELPFLAGVLHYYTITKTGTTFKLYQDTVLKATITMPDSMSSSSTCNLIISGNTAGGSYRTMGGVLDNFVIRTDLCPYFTTYTNEDPGAPPLPPFDLGTRFPGTNIFLEEPVKKLLLWNPLSSSGAISGGWLGASGAYSSPPPSYEICKFYNGVRLDNVLEYVYFSNILNSITQKGTIEFWLKPLFNHDTVTSYHMWHTSDTDFYMYYSGGDWVIVKSGSPTFSGPVQTFHSGDLLHLRIVWDKNGFIVDGYTYKFCLFVNSILTLSNNSAWVDLDTGLDFYIGINNGATFFANCVFENLKTYNYAKLDEFQNINIFEPQNTLELYDFY